MEAFGIVVGLVWTRLGAWVVGHSVGMEEILCVLSALIARRPARWRVIHESRYDTTTRGFRALPRRGRGVCGRDVR